MGDANWVDILALRTMQFYEKIYSSTNLTPIQASLKKNEKIVVSNLQGKKDKRTPKFKLGDLVRTADFKKVFSQGDCTNWSY